MGDLSLLEQASLSTASAADFTVKHRVGSGQSGLVVAATCSLPGLPSSDKLYAVKLLFNFSHEYSSVVNNSYENEWLVLSRLLPHPNIVRFWSQFVSPIPPAFTQLLPEALRMISVYKDRAGKSQSRKAQFLVLDYHPENLSNLINRFSNPLPYELTLKLTDQLLKALLFLEENKIRHLDLKPANVLVAPNERLILCDFGCAIQFPDTSFTQRYSRGCRVGGNRAHLAPEIISAVHTSRHDPSSSRILNYSKQASFAGGVLVCELATGDNPLPDYPLGYSKQGIICYNNEDLSPLPLLYPKSFRSIITDLLRVDSGERMSLSEAQTQLQVCCIRKVSVSSVHDMKEEMDRVKQERDLAVAKLSSVATERDSVVREMKVMAENCQKVAEEFEAMAESSEKLIAENKKLQRERDSAAAASESAYTASQMIQEQLVLVTRERDLAQKKCEELQLLSNKAHLKESILDCGRCKRFFLESENKSLSCQWHPGKVRRRRRRCVKEMRE